MDNKKIEILNILIHRLHLSVFLRTHNLDRYIINTVGKNPNITIKDLLSKLQVPQSTLSSAISRLCDKNILKRAISEKDTRSLTLQLTEDGKILYDEKTDLLAVEKAVSKLDNEDELDELIRLLDKVVNNL